jgi:hypothetical protein
MFILIAIAAVAVGAPILGVVLVSLASRHEDSAHSLSSHPSGMIDAAGRRLVGFHGDAIARRPSYRAAPRSGRLPAGVDLFGDGFGAGFADGGYLADRGAPADRPDLPVLLGQP